MLVINGPHHSPQLAPVIIYFIFYLFQLISSSTSWLLNRSYLYGGPIRLKPNNGNAFPYTIWTGSNLFQFYFLFDQVINNSTFFLLRFLNNSTFYNLFWQNMELLSLYLGPTSMVVLNRLKLVIGNAFTYSIWTGSNLF